MRDCVARCVVRDDSRASLARLWALSWPMTVGPEGVPRGARMLWHKREHLGLYGLGSGYKSQELLY
jgi:hypothetical protein